MRTETNPTENTKDWTPFGPKVERKAPERDEWQKSPDAAGVEYNWKTGKTRTNIPLPSAWVEDLAMQMKDEPIKQLPPSAPSEELADLVRYVNHMTDLCMFGVGAQKVAFNVDRQAYVITRVPPQELYR